LLLYNIMSSNLHTFKNAGDKAINIFQVPFYNVSYRRLAVLTVYVHVRALMTLFYIKIRLIYVNTPLFTRLYTMFQTSRGHPQGQLIHFVSRVSKIASRCKYQIKDQGALRYVVVLRIMAALRWECGCHWMTTLRPRESRELLAVNLPWPRTRAPRHFCKQLLLRHLTPMRFVRHNFVHFNYIQFRDKTRFFRPIICFLQKVESVLCIGCSTCIGLSTIWFNRIHE
jgi:hypothetical protein